jgi:hypothetical protein
MARPVSDLSLARVAWTELLCSRTHPSASSAGFPRSVRSPDSSPEHTYRCRVRPPRPTARCERNPCPRPPAQGSFRSAARSAPPSVPENDGRASAGSCAAPQSDDLGSPRYPPCTQHKSLPLPQKSAVRIRCRLPGYSRLTQPPQLLGNLLQPLSPTRLRLGPTGFLRLLTIALLLPLPDLPPDTRPLLPEFLFGEDAIPRGVGCHPSRVDRHVSQPRPALPASPLHHLREHIADGPRVPSPERVQRPVIRFGAPPDRYRNPRSSRVRCSSRRLEAIPSA